MTDDDFEAAWTAVHDATPTGWYAGQLAQELKSRPGEFG